MSNKGGRVSPDYLADIAPEYAWTYFGTSIGLAALTGLFSGLAITTSDDEMYMTMSVLSGLSATALLTVDIVSIADAVKTAKRKNRLYNDIWEKRR